MKTFATASTMTASADTAKLGAKWNGGTLKIYNEQKLTDALFLLMRVRAVLELTEELPPTLKKDIQEFFGGESDKNDNL